MMAAVCLWTTSLSSPTTAATASSLCRAPSISASACTFCAWITCKGVALTKAGSGQLVLDNVSSTTPNIFAGTTIDIQAGKVAAFGSSVAGSTDPLGTAAVTIDGGTLSLHTLVGNPAAAFDNPITVAQS